MILKTLCESESVSSESNSFIFSLLRDNVQRVILFMLTITSGIQETSIKHSL